MICKTSNSHINQLLDKQEILWKCKLSNGEYAWSDFEYEDEDPWTRLRSYCKENNVDITEIYVMIAGMMPSLVFSDPDGLDGVFAIRGAVRELTDDNADLVRYMCFGKYEKETDTVHVEKFFWPDVDIIPKYETRLLTEENQKLMIFKNRKCCKSGKCQKKEQN